MTAKDGVYFNMPEKDYFALNRVSRSLLKDMRISPLYAWENNLNPNRKVNKTRPMDFGSAMHYFLLEGGIVDGDRISVIPEKTSDKICSMTALRSKAEALGLGKARSAKKLISMIREAGDTTPIYYEELERHKQAVANGAAEIDSSQAQYILSIQKLLDTHPIYDGILSDGYSEITILWTNEWGVKMKCRIDRLSPENYVLELKTFSLNRKMSVDKALPLIMAQEEYHLQPVIYMDALKCAAEFDLSQWHDVPESVDVNALQHRCSAHSSAAPLPFIFLFIGSDYPHIRAKGFAPMIDGVRMTWWESGEHAYKNACQEYLKQTELFGDEPWRDVAELSWFSDYEQPIWSAE